LLSYRFKTNPIYGVAGFPADTEPCSYEYPLASLEYKVEGSPATPPDHLICEIDALDRRHCNI